VPAHSLERDTDVPKTAPPLCLQAGLDVEHIMRLGGWENLDMVLRYTRSVKFEDSLKPDERRAKDNF